MMRSAMQRVCFQLRVKPERIEEYRERHAAVWPEMLEALKASGWSNYSIFLREDGLLIGYYETQDRAASAEAMSRTDVNARWQADMAPFFAESDGSPERSFTDLVEVFNLEDQLDTIHAAASAHERTHS